MDTIAFARGVPAPEMLPVDELRRAMRAAYDVDPVALLSYGTGAGWAPLRARLAARHGVDAERIVVTTGSLQGFVLLAQTIARRAQAAGRRARVVVEQPTYDRPLLMLRRLGIDVVAVPLGDDGIDVDAFDAALADGADFAYLIPTYQNPAGTTLPLEGRRAVLESARRHGVPVLEDDPYGLLHFDEPAPTSIFELADGDESIVWYSGSTSKTVAPGLRVGWLILPPDLARDVATAANDEYISATLLGQAILDAYFEQGSFEPGVERSRGMLRERRDLLASALQQHLPDASYVRPAGGYFAWVRLPGGIDGAAVAKHAAAIGVTVVPGASFGEACEPYVRIAFSSPPVERIDAGIELLARACATAAAGA